MLTVPEQGHVNVNINMRYSTDRFVMSIVNIVLSIKHKHGLYCCYEHVIYAQCL